MEQKKKRLMYLDRCKGLGILLITLGHIITLGVPLKDWMAPFKISIFYVVAGWILAMNPQSCEMSVGKRVKKLFFSLMWPYFTLSILGILTRGMWMIFKMKSVPKRLLYDLKKTLTLQGIGPMWFLPSLFLAQVIFFLVLKSRIRSLQGLCFAVPLFVAPHMRAWYNLFPKESLRQAALLLPMKALIALWFLQMGYWGFLLLRRLESRALQGALGGALILGTLVMVPFTPSINLNYLKLGQPIWFFFVGGLMGSFGFLLLFQALEGVLHEPLLTYWGRNSIILMGTQRGMSILNFTITGMSHYIRIHKNECPRYYLESFLIFIVVLALEYTVTELILRYAPFVVRFPAPKRAKS